MLCILCVHVRMFTCVRPEANTVNLLQLVFLVFEIRSLMGLFCPHIPQCWMTSAYSSSGFLGLWGITFRFGCFSAGTLQIEHLSGPCIFTQGGRGRIFPKNIMFTFIYLFYICGHVCAIVCVCMCVCLMKSQNNL